jgi:O-antigen/teichoic acid export membrane protein
VSVARTAARNGLWFAAFKFGTQIMSWFVTLAIARILTPNDYGLMSLASILTGYVEIFSELGLGAAIVQRDKISQNELSSNFWFSILVGLTFSVVAFGLAYPTAWIFNEPRVLPITKLIAVLFLIGGTMIVPFNMLMREMRFKAIGIIQLAAVAVSSGSMLWMASHGFGVWTLIVGTILMRSMIVLLVFATLRWFPTLHFRWSEVRPFLRFGINVAASRSLFFVFQRSDVFVIGKVLGTQSLGFYSFAVQLASMPTDKIAALINQVSYPVFARFQNDREGFQDVFLRTNRYLSILASPLYLAGALWSEEIIRGILGDQWAPIIFLFRMLCLSQLVVSTSVLNGAAHTSLGRAHWMLYFNAAGIALMPASIWVAAHYGLAAAAIPWVTVYPIICLVWTIVTLRKLDITTARYFRSAGIHVLASLVIVAGVKLISLGFSWERAGSVDYRMLLGVELVLGAIAYLTYLWVRERDTLRDLWMLRKA